MVCVGRVALLSPTCIQRLPSDGSSACENAVENGPLVVRSSLSRFLFSGLTNVNTDLGVVLF